MAKTLTTTLIIVKLILAAFIVFIIASCSVLKTKHVQKTEEEKKEVVSYDEKIEDKLEEKTIENKSEKENNYKIVEIFNDNGTLKERTREFIQKENTYNIVQNKTITRNKQIVKAIKRTITIKERIKQIEVKKEPLNMVLFCVVVAFGLVIGYKFKRGF